MSKSNALLLLYRFALLYCFVIMMITFKEGKGDELSARLAERIKYDKDL